jgi:hypothetical protein
MADKIADGWVYGEEKMRCLRHHCIVAFEKPIPTEKNYLLTCKIP